MVGLLKVQSSIFPHCQSPLQEKDFTFKFFDSRHREMRRNVLSGSLPLSVFLRARRLMRKTSPLALFASALPSPDAISAV